MTRPIIILGASRGPGRLIYEKLRAQNLPVLGIARTRRGIESDDFIECDASDTAALAELVPGDAALVHCTRPEFLIQLLQLEPKVARLVAVGSTRVYTRFPDDKCTRLAEMSHAIWMRDIPSTILHPTMIYGTDGFNNIERIVSIARRSPWIPLPEDGKALIQPVHVNDVVTAIENCLNDDTTISKTIVLAGKEPISYRSFVELCIAQAGQNCSVINMPYTLVALLGFLTQLVPFIPTISQDEIRRLLENKDHDTTDMKTLLGVDPISLKEGLASIR